MTAKTKKITFWVIIAVLVIGLGIYLKYATFGATVVTIVTGAACLVAGWIAHVLYGKYISDK